jgi:hypothetical protein
MSNKQYFCIVQEITYVSEVGSLQEGIVGANSGKNSQNQAKAQDQNGLNSEN